MPFYRVVGHVQVPFIHNIEAPTQEEAERQVENMRLDALDNADQSDGETTISHTVEVDEDGEEVS